MSHLGRISKFLNPLHLKETKDYKGFDPQITSTGYLSIISYSTYFIRAQEIIEGVEDNDPNTKKATKKE